MTENVNQTERLQSTCPLTTWAFGRNSGADQSQKRELVFGQVQSELPAEAPEKLYFKNAQRIIPGLGETE